MIYSNCNSETKGHIIKIHFWLESQNKRREMKGIFLEIVNNFLITFCLHKLEQTFKTICSFLSLRFLKTLWSRLRGGIVFSDVESPTGIVKPLSIELCSHPHILVSPLPPPLPQPLTPTTCLHLSCTRGKWGNGEKIVSTSCHAPFSSHQWIKHLAILYVEEKKLNIIKVVGIYKSAIR